MAAIEWTRNAVLLLTIVALSTPGLASSTGPFLGANGIPGGTTCDTAGCHGGAPPDAAQGSVRILGLPTEWTPDATYNLQVVVQRPSAIRFGFQLSALFSSGGQAGSFSTTDPRISIITGFSLSTPFLLQYAQHNDAPFGSGQWSFAVSWHAPSSAVSGDVTFYAAGNAANGNMANSGDAIYLTNARVSPVAIAMLNSHAYSIANLGGVTLKTDGLGSSVGTGYARLLPDAGNTTPTGIAIFGFRTNNVLVSETSVPASPLIRSGRIFAEVTANAVVNTGIAIANPNAQSATISFSFTNSAGTDSASGLVTVPPNGQIAKFLNEAPFNGGTNVQGTLTLSSDIPVAVIALRGFTNERGEFLLTTLPVIDLASTPPVGTQVLSHYADGGGWTTQVVLINPTDDTLRGSIDFYSPGSNIAAGSLMNSAVYSVNPRSSQRVLTTGTGTAISTGSVQIVPDGGGRAPVSLAVFSFKPAGITIAAAGVPAVRGTAFRMYAESSGISGSAGSIQTGIAIANTSATPATVNLELYRLDGTPAGLSASLSLPASGQISKFIGEMFPGMTQPFQGVLRVVTPTVPLSVVGLRGRYNERADFLITTTPPSVEGANAAVTEMDFPHLANGGGYTTQFILFSGIINQTVSGVVRVLQPDGAAFNLTLN